MCTLNSNKLHVKNIFYIAMLSLCTLSHITIIISNYLEEDMR